MKVRDCIEKYKLNKKLLDSIQNDSYRDEEEESLAIRLKEENETIKETVHSIGEPYSDIIMMHYFRGLSLRFIAKRLFYSYPNIVKMRKKAEELLEEKLNKTENT